MSTLLEKLGRALDKKRFAIPLFPITLLIVGIIFAIGKIVDIIRFKVLRVKKYNIEELVRLLADKYGITIKHVRTSCMEMIFNNKVLGIHNYNSDNTSTVSINANVFNLNSTYSTLHLIWVILHELRHAQQHQEGWFDREDNKYINWNEDMVAYRIQDYEVDANEFAYREVFKHLNLLFKK